MFDAHCHLTAPRLRADAQSAWARARGVGVTGALMAGIDEEDWRLQQELHQALPEVLPCYGLHPQVVAELSESEVRRQLDVLASLLNGSAKPAALGETGLDRAVAPAQSMPLQELVFREQLALARDCELPVVLHVLRAQERALNIIERDGPPSRGGIVHSYSGSAELVPRWLKLGFHISFAGPVSWEGARRVQLAAAAVPRSALLVETDAPDQSPEPVRRERNEPANLVHVIEALARARRESPTDLAQITYRNAQALLGL